MTTKLTLIPNKHPHEDAFEKYAFDRLSSQEAADFEEHLLICEQCRSTLTQTDEFIRLMKASTTVYAPEHSGGRQLTPGVESSVYAGMPPRL